MNLFKENSLNKTNRTTDLILVGLGLIVLAYTITRAYLLSFTWDESWSYIEYVRKEGLFRSDFNTMSANNHLLNTWLMKICLHVLGLSEMALRLPNLLAHALFIIYSAKLSKKLSHPVLIISCFLILNFNPFLLDFFSLARGYGISMGLMMGSLYFAYQFIEGNKNYSRAFLSVLFAALAALAIVSLLNFLLIITGLLLLINSIRFWKKDSKKIQIILKENLIILLPLMVLIFLVPIIINEKNSKAFFFGGDSGFFYDSIVTLITATVFEHLILIRIFQVIVMGIFLVLLPIGFKVIKEKVIIKLSWKFSYWMFIALIFTLCILSNIIQHTWLGILFPMERTALYYYPLFILLFLFLIHTIYGRFTKPIAVAMTVLALFFSVNFIANANFTYALSWKCEADIKSMLSYLIQNKKAIPEEKNNLNVGIQFFEPDINFYRNAYHLTWLNLSKNWETYHSTNDYFFIYKENIPKLPNVKYKILKEFPVSNTVLISNEQKWNKKEIYHKKLNFDKPAPYEHFNTLSDDVSYHGTNSSRTDSAIHYSDGFSYKIDDSLLNNKTALVVFKAMIYAEDVNADANLIISFEKDSKPYSYYFMHIKDVVNVAHEWIPLYITSPVPMGIKKDDLLKCYLWNLGNYPVYIDEMELKIVAYEK